MVDFRENNFDKLQYTKYIWSSSKTLLAIPNHPIQIIDQFEANNLYVSAGHIFFLPPPQIWILVLPLYRGCGLTLWAVDVNMLKQPPDKSHANMTRRLTDFWNFLVRGRIPRMIFSFDHCPQISLNIWLPTPNLPKFLAGTTLFLTFYMPENVWQQKFYHLQCTFLLP